MRDHLLPKRPTHWTGKDVNIVSRRSDEQRPAGLYLVAKNPAEVKLLQDRMRSVLRERAKENHE